MAGSFRGGAGPGFGGVARSGACCAGATTAEAAVRTAAIIRGFMSAFLTARGAPPPRAVARRPACGRLPPGASLRPQALLTVPPYVAPRPARCGDRAAATRRPLHARLQLRGRGSVRDPR